MSGYVLTVDLFGLALAVTGFSMAFRQAWFRRLIGKPRPPTRSGVDPQPLEPLTYILRIAGVMVMIFGVVITLLTTLFSVMK